MLKFWLSGFRADCLTLPSTKSIYSFELICKSPSSSSRNIPRLDGMLEFRKFPQVPLIINIINQLQISGAALP